MDRPTALGRTADLLRDFRHTTTRALAGPSPHRRMCQNSTVAVTGENNRFCAWFVSGLVSGVRTELPFASAAPMAEASPKRTHGPQGDYAMADLRCAGHELVRCGPYCRSRTSHEWPLFDAARLMSHASRVRQKHFQSCAPPPRSILSSWVKTAPSFLVAACDR